MKNYLKYVFALFVFASFYACSDDDVINTVADSGTGINFGMRSVDSRTIYESTDSKQILWNDGDQVRIFCAQAFLNENDLYASGNAKADYTVTRSTEDGDKDGSKGEEGTIKPSSTTQLRWGYGEHQFYAVYPANNNITVNALGIATFPINRDQKCYIQTDAEKAADNDASKYTYVARPDMSNAYMVASTASAPTEDAVWLDFKPVMTTLNIVVKGPQNLTSAGTPDNNSTADPIVVTGVSIISTITSNSNADKSTFMYDIKNNKITGSAPGSGTATEQTETTFVSIVNTDGLNAITLNQGETLALTAFLPPMDSETAETLQRDIKIRVHTTGGNKTMTLEDATALLPSAKGAIKLPSMYTPITGSNWITPLDDDIYVSQLSIPGTHDAATYAGTIGNLGQTQDYTIEQQWDMGIRAFDFRPALFGTYYIVSWANLQMWNWHGVTKTDLTFKAGLDAIIAKMTPNSSIYTEGKDEFAIVIFKHENEIGLEVDWDWGIQIKNTNTDTWQENMQKILEEYKDRIVQFRPDLTIGDCRGKIIMLCRDWTPYTDTGLPTYGGYMGWSHDRAGSKVESIYGPDGTKGNFYIQDCFDADEAKLGNGETFLEVKANVIKDFMNEAAKFHTDETKKNTWMINHTSGYSDNSLISGTMIAYQDNAQYQNPRFYSYLTGNSVTINNEVINEGTKPTGSVGIVMMDWVGTRTVNGYTVFGDLLPQAIIDNNYKYRMKREGE